jgi:hypothetical protein
MPGRMLFGGSYGIPNVRERLKGMEEAWNILHLFQCDDDAGI